MSVKYDMLWKGMLEEVFDDFLQFIYPEAEQVFDLGKGFEFLDKELIEMYPEPDKKEATRFVDKLVKVFRRDGREQWLLVHVEVQEQRDPKFSERMFRYYYRLFDRYQHPITAIAIFTGVSGKRMPRKYVYDFLGTRLTYSYNTCCITDYPDETLAKSNNPFALVMLAAKKALLSGKVPEQELLKQKLLVARILLQKRTFTKQKIKNILIFLNNYILFAEPQTNITFTNEVDYLTGKKKSMGIVEQLAEIRAEEATEKAALLFVENLLKGTDFTPKKIAALANVSLDFVKKVKASLPAKQSAAPSR